ncbi:MAG TPA: carboxylating nicotinate-nucleotide diphosphorylase [Rhodospirillales bacterium]|nr:carboxylating nicotinate-nucleotide diphosphorylase [Rhodospirillales bacterium]
MPLSAHIVNRIIDAALAEDLGRDGDITSNAVIPEDARLDLVMAAREDIVVCGLDIAAEVFRRLAPQARIKCEIPDGTPVVAGTALMRLEGPARGLLAAERTALNLVQHLSGIATLTRTYVEAIEGTGAVLLDTRKTVPGLRDLAKYAARMGGAANHRMRLDDGVLIKDNHIAVAGGAGAAMRRAVKAGLTHIEVECDTVEQVTQALDAGAGRVLLDNMDLAALRRAVAVNAGRAKLEASGGVNLKNIRAIADTGVDFISVGRITQSAPAVDIGLDLEGE